MLTILHRTPLSRAGCASLAAQGVQVFEIDLRAVGGVVVVSHYLPVWTALPGLQRDNWRLRWRRRFTPETHLAEVLGLLPPHAEVLLDLKDDHAASAGILTGLLLATVADPGRFYVSSKNWPALAPLRAAGFRTWPTVATRRALALALTGAAGAAGDAVTVRNAYLTGAVVRRLREVSRAVVAWTVNDAARAVRLREWGVTGVTTDSLDVVRAVR